MWKQFSTGIFNLTHWYQVILICCLKSWKKKHGLSKVRQQARVTKKQKKQTSSKLQISYKYNEGYVNAMDLTIGTLTLPQGKENFFFS